MNEYRLTLTHDNGKIKIRTWATDEESAINNVMKAENCPRCAIIKVKQISL